MLESNIELPAVDFTLRNTKKRRLLYLKRPKNAPIPIGLKWRCICGTDNTLNANIDQYCAYCGSRLRLQENAEEDSQYWTTVVVSHFNIRPR